MMKLEVRYRAELMSTMVATTAIAWSLRSRAENISFTVAVFISVGAFSFTLAQQMISVTTKIPETIRATYWKPVRSLLPPSAPTSSMVNMAMRAEPTPAQVRPTTERVSRSLGVLVTAGIMDQ